MLTAAGSGFSRWGDLAVTRWREDPTCDGWGSYVLLSDFASRAVWSACVQPCAGDPAAHAVTFSEGRGEFVHRGDSLTTTLEVAVASDVSEPAAEIVAADRPESESRFRRCRSARISAAL